MIPDKTGRVTNEATAKRAATDRYKGVPQESGASSDQCMDPERWGEQEKQRPIRIEKFPNKDNSFRLRRVWKPETLPDKKKNPTRKPYHYGVPSLIFHESLKYTQKREVQRIESRLYYFGPSRIPRSGTTYRDIKKLKHLKTEARQWRQIRSRLVYQEEQKDKEGNKFIAWRNFGSIWILEPEYVYQILNEDQEQRRYRFGTASKMNNTTPPLPSNLRPDLAEYLRGGTKIFPNHAPAYEALYKPIEKEDPTAYQEYMDALKAWQTLSKIRPGHEIKPHWSVSLKDGRLYCHSPYLQGISGNFRNKCFTDKNGGSVAEVDISSCFINLALIEQGRNPIPDYWKYAAGILREKGYRITDKQASNMGNEIFGGCSKGLFCQRYADILADPAAFFEDYRGIIPVKGNHNALSMQAAAIMERVLLDMMNTGIPPGILVHDSVVIPKLYAEQVKKIIVNASEELTGCPLHVKVK